VKDILIAGVDGLKGFPDTINTAYPETQIQLCIVHMVRNSGHQEAQTASHRGLGEEGHLFGDTAGLKKVDHANSQLEANAQSIHTPQGGTEVIEFEDRLVDYI